MVTVVTGAHGFLGQYIVEDLRARGTTVVTAGRPETEIPSRAFDELLADASPDVVVHCAGPASVQRSIAEPDWDRKGSVDVARALVASLERLPAPPRLVLLSSAAVYGDPAQLPVREADAPAPISPYGRHRLEVENIVRSSSLDCAVLRVFSAYGEGLRRQILWDIVTRALDSSQVTLSGTGAESRDFVHAKDVASAVGTVCEREAFDGETLNVASGLETTVRDLASLAVEALDSGTRVAFSGSARAGDPLRWRADVSRLLSLGWRPEVPLSVGVPAYVRWARAVLG
jgi:UDP-glucose 4-epimerase